MKNKTSSFLGSTKLTDQRHKGATIVEAQWMAHTY